MSGTYFSAPNSDRSQVGPPGCEVCVAGRSAAKFAIVEFSCVEQFGWLHSNVDWPGTPP